MNAHVKHLIVKIAFLVGAISFLLTGNTQGQVNDTLSHIYQLAPVIITALRIPVKESSVPYSITIMATRKNLQGLSLGIHIGTLAQ